MAIVLDGVGTVNGVTLPTTGFGKVLQVVRATDTTSRSTSSTSYVDITGMSVTITPQKSDSQILLIFTAQTSIGNGRYVSAQITDSSNNAISGAEDTQFGVNAGTISTFYFNLLARVAPATTSAVTFKLRSKVNADTVTFTNNTNTAQMYAIEVSA